MASGRRGRPLSSPAKAPSRRNAIGTRLKFAAFGRHLVQPGCRRQRLHGQSRRAPIAAGLGVNGLYLSVGISVVVASLMLAVRFLVLTQRHPAGVTRPHVAMRMGFGRFPTRYYFGCSRVWTAHH